MFSLLLTEHMIMLLTLNIKNLAVVVSSEITFGPGFTAITGETGAGKSIVLDALQLALGGRSRADMVRNGADQAEIQALFDISGNPQIRDRLLALDLECGDDLVIRRVVGKNGRSRAYVNGVLSSVGTLTSIVGGLVDISGQHAHYSLLRPDAHLALVDRLGGHMELAQQVNLCFQRVMSLDSRIDSLRSNGQIKAEREEFLRFQLLELDRAELLDPEEGDTLIHEATRLRNSERLRMGTTDLEERLYSGGNSVLDLLRRAERELDDLCLLDEELCGLKAELSSAIAILDDTSQGLVSYAQNATSQPERLNEVEDRLGLFSRLCRKHGGTLGSVIERWRSLREELLDLGQSDQLLEVCLQERQTLVESLAELANRLSDARRVASKELVSEVESQLMELGMEGAALAVDFLEPTIGVTVDNRRIGSRGAERIRLLLSANRGQAPQGLDRVASGGELSRVMLAIKRVIAERDPVSTYIFDEVDAGIGGPTGEIIGHKLGQVARERQVICITHLAQIASRADVHLVVSKEITDDSTVSRIQALSSNERVSEIARMIGGQELTEATRKHAEEMIALAQRAA
jgi:DNA repair protein RecN (Recombination protein N)